MMAIGVVQFAVLVLSSHALSNGFYPRAIRKTIHSSTKQSTTIEEEKTKITPGVACPYCGIQLASRNKLYGHLRASASCERSAVSDGLNLELRRPKPKRKVILIVGYRGEGIEGDKVASALLASLEKIEGLPIKSLSRCTDHRYRLSDLFKRDAPAVEDVFVFTCTNEGNSLDEGEAKSKWLDMLNRDLASHCDNRGEIKVYDREYAHDDYVGTLHAEGSCTARVYECVLPFSYLSDGPPPTDFEIMALFGGNFKTIMKSLSSQKFDKCGYRNRRSTEQIEARESKCWHNFCEGQAEPSDSAVKRSVDRFYLYEKTREHRAGPDFMVHLGNDHRSFLRIRVSADGVLAGQIEKMVATAICIYRGWLSPAFAHRALDARTLIETPTLGPGLVHLRHARFDWNTPKQNIFRLKALRDPKAAAGISAFESALLFDIASSEAASDAVSKEWVSHMIETTCPAINATLSLSRSREGESRKVGSVVGSESGECPPEYADVLRLMREADSSGLWPSTSRARSRVVIGGSEDSGSFSAASPSALSGDYAPGNVLGLKPPRGNVVFPDLIKAIFDLERRIAPDRPASTMVAINRRASFLPHTDAGAGFGQSRSLIVGLGDYAGGELAVEGNAVDIRFSPLTFDGWRERHWTLPFTGERFSLVWFTPAAYNQEASALRYPAASTSAVASD